MSAHDPLDPLDELIARLERAAEQLRSGELSADAAATLVEDCAALATQASAELERRARSELHAPRPGRTRCCAGPAVDSRLRERRATRDHLRAEVEELPGGDALLRGAADGGAGGGDALLAAGGRQAHPPGARAGDARARSGSSTREVLPLAGAIELIHTYSLIHDDLPAMDDDELRRGQPTCHVASARTWRSSPGDGLYAEAFHQLLPSSAPRPSGCWRAAAELAARDGRQRHGGRPVRRRQGLAPRGPAGLRRLHELKTGRLIAASVMCVLLLARRGRTCDNRPCAVSRQSWVCCSRSSTTSST